MSRIPCLLITLLCCAGNALASSDDAWKQHDRRVLAACTAVSKLKDARPAGQAVVFDDRLGLTALMLTGRYPQPHMKGRNGNELCLYARKTGNAYISEADRLMGSGTP